MTESPMPGTPQTADKAIAAIIGGLVTVAALFVPGVEDRFPPEVVAALGTVLSAALVYIVPNRPK